MEKKYKGGMGTHINGGGRTKQHQKLGVKRELG